MLRLFVALRPPAPMRDSLIATMHGVANARWQSDEQLHLTLAFLGAVDEAVAERIDAGLRAMRRSPLTLGIAGVGAFDDRDRVSALWAAAGPADGLQRLAYKVGQICRKAGAVPDGRAFVPHITLARLNRSSGPVDSWLAAHAALCCPAVPVAAVGLYESRLGSGGSSYDLLAEYRLD